MTLLMAAGVQLLDSANYECSDEILTISAMSSVQVRPHLGMSGVRTDSICSHRTSS